MATSRDYFAQQGIVSDPGAHATLFDGLPAGVGALCQVVQGLLLHIFWAERYGVQLSAEQRGEVQLRLVERQLARIQAIDPRPLYEARPLERRLIGNCRDFSVLLTSMLRHQGIPARARCGFGRYFIPGHFEDHWVCEYWNAAEGRWVLVDAQLDALQRDQLAIAFDPLDVPRDQFIVGGKAWQMCRMGDANPDCFGIADMHGLWFVRGDFVRDVAALNRVELLPWDSWGIIEGTDEELVPEDWTLLDHLAELTAGDVPDFDQVRLLYETDRRLRVPEAFHSYTPAGMQTVSLAAG